MNTDETRYKLKDVLEEIGINSDMQEIFLYMLEPIIQDYIEEELRQNFTDEETKDIVERATEDDRLNEADIGGLLFFEYEQKTGNSIEKVLDDYLAEFAKNLKDIHENFKKEINNLEELSPEEQVKKMIQDLNTPIDINTAN